MITKERIPEILGHTAFDSSHQKLGTIGQVYIDDQTGQPEWMTVRTGMFGIRESFVPIQPAEIRGEEILVPFEKAQVKDAPNVEPQPGGQVSVQEEARLYQHYGLSPAAGGGTEVFRGPERQTFAPAAGDTMTRSEENLRVGKETREAGRVHLRKYVETEEQQQTVPVRKEKARVEHEPITEQNRDRTAAPEISEEAREVVLEEERPVVTRETTPIERVRLAKESETGEETVRGTVRKERIETEGLPGDTQS